MCRQVRFRTAMAPEFYQIRKREPEFAPEINPLKVPLSGRYRGQEGIIQSDHYSECHIPQSILRPKKTISGKRWYVLNQDECNEHNQRVRYASVNTILDATKPDHIKFALHRWRKAKIAELGEEGFKKFSSGIMTGGSRFHKLIELYLQGGRKSIPEHDMTLFSWFVNCKPILDQIEFVTHVETTVIHPQMGYAGTCDCVAMYNGHLCVVDWKTRASGSRKDHIRDTYDNPVQIAAYAGAINADRLYDERITAGLLVISYPDQPPSIHFIEPDKLIQYWQQWATRVTEYYNSGAQLPQTASMADASDEEEICVKSPTPSASASTMTPSRSSASATQSIASKKQTPVATRKTPVYRRDEGLEEPEFKPMFLGSPPPSTTATRTTSARSYSRHAKSSAKVTRT
eukprot:Clim_evm43s253 gene=Clim_evmTU43s253